MNHSEKSQTCEEAELYYLSLAFGGEYGDVPKGVAAHVESCGYCRTQLKVLREHLLTADTGDSESSRLSEAQTHILGLHFAYLGKEVGCDVVKPFLPSLLDPSLKARIPTPITVHLDRCESCKRDLAAIRNMDLTAKQLSTLNSILSDDLSVRNVDCSVAADSIQQYVNFDFQRIEPEVIKHLCCCNVCQSLLYRVRAESIRALREKDVQTGFPCESVTFSDVFDYCFPYGLVPWSDQYASFREPFVNELKQCAKCLAKVQDLHQQVYAMRQRPESGVKTVYEIGQVLKSDAEAHTESNYRGFPVNVRTLNSVDNRPSPNVRQKQTAESESKPRIFRIGFKHLVKVAVAAIVVFAITLFMKSTPTAAALTLQQVYDAIQKAVNVHIQQFAADSTEPLQEKWVSKDLGIYAVQDKNGFMIWDVPNKLKHIKPTGSLTAEAFPLSEMQEAAIRKKIQGSLGLMPFEDVSEVPRDARWEELDISGMDGISADTRVYELTWRMPAQDGSIVGFKWRGFIEETTNRPVRAEFYSCDTSPGEYKLRTVHSMEYWTESQIRELLQSLQP